jgi:hypothetical protein
MRHVSPAVLPQTGSQVLALSSFMVVLSAAGPLLGRRAGASPGAGLVSPRRTRPPRRRHRDQRSRRSRSGTQARSGRAPTRPRRPVSISTHYLHHGGDIRYVEQFLTRQIGKDWDSAKNGLSDDPGNGLKIVRQALNAVQTNDTLSDVLLSGVSQARVADTDTVCAIAAAVSSRRMDVRDDLPESLRQGCENGTFGRDYLKHVDRHLMARFPSTKQYERYIS